jgi:hypothetical protein
MRQFSLTSEQQDGLRTRLTDPATIASAVKLLRQAGYTELAIWRHFLDAFAVDLDMLSLIMKELFGKPRASGELRPATPLPSSTRNRKPKQPRAA